MPYTSLDDFFLSL